MRKHLSYANVMASIAVFIALGGASYAAVKIPTNSVGSAQLKKNAVIGSKIKARTIRGSDIAVDTVLGSNIKESSLSKVPSAKVADTATSADTAKTAATATSASTASTATTATSAENAGTVGGLTATQLTQRCPTGTVVAYGLCLQLKDNSPTAATYPVAAQACSTVGGRLPTWFELNLIRSRTDTGFEWAAGTGSNQYELTSDPYAIATTTDVVALDQAGNKLNAGAATPYHYRCLIYPSNR